MKKKVESNWNQISDDEWEIIDRDSVIKKFGHWIYSQVDVDKKIKSVDKDGNLFIRIDNIILETTEICAPCSQMEENLEAEGYNAMREHGEITATIIQIGEIKLGDTIELI